LDGRKPKVMFFIACEIKIQNKYKQYYIYQNIYRALSKSGTGRGNQWRRKRRKER
jgi:hypothetical protein